MKTNQIKNEYMKSLILQKNNLKQNTAFMKKKSLKLDYMKIF